jgi:conjugal transfer pilus assembly protein TraU
LILKTGKIVIVFLTITLLWIPTNKAEAICKPGFLNPVIDVCWQCIFPIKIGGIPIKGVEQVGNGPLIDTPDLASLPLCICPFPPPVFMRIGIPVSFWEPARFVETVKDPFCFPSIGVGLPNPFSGHLGGGSSEMGNQEDMSSFAQAHWFVFPVWAMMELLTDFVCIEHSVFDVAYLTEVDPLWNSDMLAFILNPEALLFANPIAQFACVADSVASAVGLSLSPLFWCMGSWGSAYPLTGHVGNDNLVEANAAMGARMIFKLGREFLLWDPGLTLCAAIPTPIWVKQNYRMQIAKPVRSIGCIPIGRTGLMWSYFKNPPIIGDNFLFMVFRKRACCVF